MKKESKDLFRKVLNLLAIDFTKEKQKNVPRIRMNRKVHKTAKNKETCSSSLPESTTLRRSAFLYYPTSLK